MLKSKCKLNMQQVQDALYDLLDIIGLMVNQLELILIIHETRIFYDFLRLF